MGTTLDNFNSIWVPLHLFKVIHIRGDLIDLLDLRKKKSILIILGLEIGLLIFILLYTFKQANLTTP